VRKSKDIPTVRVEIMPPAGGGPRDGSGPRPSAVDAKAMLKKLVEQQVAEIMARREDFLFQPFLATARVSNEIKRLQTVPEQRAWARVFAKHGCTACRSKKVGHGSCGFCSNCYSIIFSRKKAAIRGIEKDGPELPPICDPHEIALKALYGDSNRPALPPGPAAKRAPRRRS
jgi:hypothetical protein